MLSIFTLVLNADVLEDFADILDLNCLEELMVVNDPNQSLTYLNLLVPYRNLRRVLLQNSLVGRWADVSACPPLGHLALDVLHAQDVYRAHHIADDIWTFAPGTLHSFHFLQIFLLPVVDDAHGIRRDPVRLAYTLVALEDAGRR
ncbi:hypothetical protein AURDEDRAFT_168049 [Auricularia subglabra TFB-10046 SS5]|nr:hypothetical protein AURDEDRAFT_168049 [Auricularia subglabra TFB-10046 SS5]